MTRKEQWITVLVCFCLLILLTGFGFRKGGTYRPAEAITCADDLAGRSLGGVAGRMPASSSKIFFESLTGRKLSSYKAYGDMDEAVYALKSGQVSAIWTTDVTADYLMTADDTIIEIDSAGMADIQTNAETRFDFGMAAPNTEEGKALTDSINECLDYLESIGRLGELRNDYIVNAQTVDKFTPSDMAIRGQKYKDCIYVGITGAVPPVELIDELGRPYGYCVALMDNIGQLLQKDVEFVVLGNETAFSGLMAGRVDLVFCYGAGNTTLESSIAWCMTRGYLPMENYRFLTLKAADKTE